MKKQRLRNNLGIIFGSWIATGLLTGGVLQIWGADAYLNPLYLTVPATLMTAVGFYALKPTGNSTGDLLSTQILGIVGLLFSLLSLAGLKLFLYLNFFLGFPATALFKWLQINSDGITSWLSPAFAGLFLGLGLILQQKRSTPAQAKMA